MSVPILASSTDPSWASVAVDQLDATLADHAHCEKKASASAIAMIHEYPGDLELVRAMSKLAEEEMRHFREIYEVLADRGVELHKDRGDPYARRLFGHLRKHAPERKLDRLLVSALIEERSRERFCLLREELERRAETELAAKYRRLEISEGGHATLFVRLASAALGEEVALARLAELSEIEAQIVAELPIEPRIH